MWKCDKPKITILGMALLRSRPATSRPEIERAPEPETLPETLSEAEEQLRNLNAEHQAIDARLAAIPKRERDLLDGGADDAEFDELAAEQRSLRRAIVRIEAHQRRMQQRIMELDLVAKRATWAAFATKLSAAAESLDATVQSALEQQRVIIALINAAPSLHFPIATDAMFPPDVQNAPAFADYAAACRNRVGVVERAAGVRHAGPTLVEVVFLRAYHLWNAGETASFVPGMAHGLVGARVAAWPPGTLAPPDPRLTIPPVPKYGGFAA